MVNGSAIVLNELKSLNRPLTQEEMLIGRRAALQMAQEIKNKVRISAEELRRTELKFYMKQGYSEAEAREAIRLDEQDHRERIGLGKSKRCRFVWLNTN